MRNGETVAAFEREFAAYVHAKYAIALVNGTATLHTALVALGVKPGDRVAVPPLTMASTTIAVLHAGAVPRFVDVNAATWHMGVTAGGPAIYVSLYGLHQPHHDAECIDDAAQTLRKHSGAAFTSYSFQASKILALGEGGMLVTNDEELATRAREFSSLGYRLDARSPRIDPATLKSPTFERHHSLGYNYRMNDLTAARGLELLPDAWRLLLDRHDAAQRYAEAIDGCPWLTPQYVPEGWTHDYWTFAVATDTPERAVLLSEAIVKAGGERPYPAWRLTYQEPAFRHLVPAMRIARMDEPPGHKPNVECPVAESLQPRLLQMATNDLASAERNAKALKAAILTLSA